MPFGEPESPLEYDSRVAAESASEARIAKLEKGLAEACDWMEEAGKVLKANGFPYLAGLMHESMNRKRLLINRTPQAVK